MIKTIFKLGVFFFSIGCAPLAAQQSPNIHINPALVQDLQDAATELHLDGAVVIGDTITLDTAVELKSLSLFLYCNFLQNGLQQIAIGPYPTADTIFSADGTGLLGRDITIFSNLPVAASIFLPGGVGNIGKKGKNGRDGRKPANINACCNADNKGEAGQPGGNGSAGGASGRLVVRTLAAATQSHVNLYAKGGKGGVAGVGGTGGKSYKLTSAAGHPLQKHIQESKEADGVAGHPGAAGATLTADIQTISPQAFKEELKKYGVESLGGAQPAFTTLITLAPKRRPGDGEVGPNTPSENTTR